MIVVKYYRGHGRFIYGRELDRMDLYCVGCMHFQSFLPLLSPTLIKGQGRGDSSVDLPILIGDTVCLIVLKVKATEILVFYLPRPICFFSNAVLQGEFDSFLTQC